MTTRAVKHTRYINYKSFNSEAQAKSHIEKLEKLYPNRDFLIHRRKFPGKLKIRFMVRTKL